MFRLNNVEFEINDTESIFYIDNKDENGLRFALDVDFKSAEYDGENVKPAICINYFETNAKSIQDLNGRGVSYMRGSVTAARHNQINELDETKSYLKR